MTDKIKFYQINLNKSEVAQANLMVELINFKDKQFICLIQEPHFQGLKPSSIDRRYMQALHGKGSKKYWPRAMIVATKNLKLSLIENLTSRDTTCINLHTLKEELVICSSYQDITYPEVVNNIDKCVEHSKNVNKEIIIGADSNAHSQLWMSESVNSRGEIFEEFISQNNLFVSNMGNKNTYDCATGKSIIDITMVSTLLADKIRNWVVHDEDYFSDHKMISYNLDTKKPPPIFLRNFKKANWSYFTQLLSNGKWENPPISWSKETIEQEAHKLKEDITKALDKVCPEKEQKIKTKPATWWTTELHNLRRKYRIAQKDWKILAAKPNSNQVDILDKYNAFKSIRKEYGKCIKKSKSSSWRTFTSECEDIYKLNKIIFKKQQNSISMMEGCNTALQTSNLLLDTHFPGSTSLGQNLQPTSSQVDVDETSPETDVESLQATCHEQVAVGEVLNHQYNIVLDKYLDDLSFLSPQRVKEAFQDMNSYNAGGPDGMKSIVFQNLPHNTLTRISKLYKACIKLSYTPQKWCEADIIFLAKPDKPRYDLPNAFRPISKFNAILKGLEKLVKWELERTSLSEKPLHKNQHAYSRVNNVDTALVQVVDEAEKGPLRKEFTLGVFIDIAGAFNNLKTDNALDAMRNRGFPEHLVSWYESFVTNRIVNTDLLGSKARRKLHLGTPQGGVLSPLCWNVPFDELLELLNECDGITAIGFADDLVLLINGIDESTLSNLMQQALNKAQPWLLKYGLSISPSKSVAVMFTNKRKWIEYPIKINGETIPFKKEVKYLGVILDSKLSGTSHVKYKIGKAKRHLMAYHYAITKKYGPQPLLMRRAYTTIVVPALTFGCHIFGDKCLQETIKKSLIRLNRLASLLIANVAPSTPTKGLEIIYNLMPLDILIEKRASEIMARIYNQIQPSWDGIGKGKKKGLVTRWRSASTVICNNIVKTDKIPTKIVKEKHFTIHAPDDGRIKHKQATGVISYTDGSVLDDKTGCGVHTIQGERVIYNGNFYLGNTTTLFQAEVTAIRKSAEMLINKKMEKQTITFFSDSQASLAALNKLTVKSDTVDKCINALNILGKTNRIHLRWVKAHVGIHGNEVADFLAKKGSSLGEGPTNELFTPQVKQRSEINNYFHKKWSKAWKSYDQARQTKIWFPIPDSKKSSQLLRRDRNSLGRLIQFLTGHNKLKRHINIQKGVTDPHSCRLCCEEEESSFHVIAECPAMQLYRSEVFKLPTIIPNPPDWTVTQVVKFLMISPIGEMLDQD